MSADPVTQAAHGEQEEEAAILEALAKIHALHNQLRYVRETIPILLQPLHTAAQTPDVLFSGFAIAAKKAVGDVQSFQNAMKEAISREILQKARDSAAKNPEMESVEGWLGGLGGEWVIEEEKGAVEGVKDLRLESQEPASVS